MMLLLIQMILLVAMAFAAGGALGLGLRRMASGPAPRRVRSARTLPGGPGPGRSNKAKFIPRDLSQMAILDLRPVLEAEADRRRAGPVEGMPADLASTPIATATDKPSKPSISRQAKDKSPDKSRQAPVYLNGHAPDQAPPLDEAALPVSTMSEGDFFDDTPVEAPVKSRELTLKLARAADPGPAAGASPFTLQSIMAAGEGHAPRLLSAPENGVADNLKLINGIGASNERELNALGVYHFAQIAEWGAPEVAWISNRIRFPKRILSEDWIGQARALCVTPEVVPGAMSV
mgnify:CR=1 FL=1